MSRNYGTMAPGEKSQFTVFFKTVKAGNFTNIIVAGSNMTNETTAENVTEAFDNKTDNVNSTPEVNKNKIVPKNSTVYKHNTDNENKTDTHEVSKDLKETDTDFKRVTGNPIFALLAVLLALSVSRVRKFKK